MILNFTKYLIALTLLAVPYISAHSQTLRLVVGYAAGGPVDITARQFAPYLSKELGQPVIVENKPGVTGVIAADMVAKSSPSTPILYFAASPTLTIAPHVVKNLPSDPSKELVPVAPLLTFSNVLVVNKNVPFRTINELISYARSNPGKVTYGSSGMGATNHLSGELLAQRTDIKLTHVPYKGNAPAMMDVIGGQITMMFDITGTAHNFINNDRVRAIAVTSRDRNPSLPNIPTMRESGIVDYEVGGWFGIFGPAQLSADLAERYNNAIRSILSNTEFRAKLKEGGYEVWSGSQKDLTDRMLKESSLWATVTKNIKFD